MLHGHRVFVFAQSGNPSWMGTLGHPAGTAQGMPAAQGKESSGEITFPCSLLPGWGWEGWAAYGCSKHDPVATPLRGEDQLCQ